MGRGFIDGNTFGGTVYSINNIIFSVLLVLPVLPLLRQEVWI